jgi:iron complex transport system substrate-binding protein
MTGRAARALVSRAGLVLALALALSVGGGLLGVRAGSEPGPPVRRLAAQRPGRIISLVPAVTEMLFAMGAGDAVVGVSSYDSYPPEAATRPRVGALIDPDVERILSLRPDLVIVYGTQDDLVARLRRAGIAMFPYEHAGLADITATIRSVGRRVGRADAADRVAGAIEADLDAIRAAVAGRPRPGTALLFGREQGELRGLFASGGVGFLHDMLVAAGGANAFADVQRQSAQISVETLLTRAPEVIMEVHPAAGWTPERVARERQVWRALTTLPAVRDGRIYIVADDRMSVPGPRVAEAVRIMAMLLHPEAFRKPGLFLSPQKQARLTR